MDENETQIGHQVEYKKKQKKKPQTRQNRERERDFHLNALTFLFAHVFAFWVETLHRESDRGNWMKKRAKLSWA